MKFQSVNVTTPGASTLDRANAAGPFAWIIDAAPGENLDVDAARFAENLDETLEHTAKGHKGSIREFLIKAFNAIESTPRSGAALAVIHDKGDGDLDYAMIGTVEIHGFHHGGKEVTTDRRLTQATVELKAKKTALQRKGGLDAKSNEQLTTGIINLENQKARKGYWLADGSLEVLDHMFFGTLDANRPVVAVTAGFTKNSRQNPLVMASEDPDWTLRQVHRMSGRNSLAALVGLPEMFK